MDHRRVLVPYPATQPEVGLPLRPSSLIPVEIQEALRHGRWDVAVRLAMGAGITDLNQLTDTLFYQLHPKLRGRPCEVQYGRLAREWAQIRDQRVWPVLRATQPGSVRTSFGIDTASTDDNLKSDWALAKARVPLELAIVRANQGTAPDPHFRHHWPRLKAAGLVRGAYLFLRFPHPRRDRPASPVAQARAFIATVGNLDQSEFPPSLDVEFPDPGRKATGMTARQVLDGVRAAWRVLRDCYGVPPIIYTSRRVWCDELDNLPAADLVESPLWLTPYIERRRRPAIYDPRRFAGGRCNPPVPSPWGDPTNWWIHQYQGDATRLPGFRGIVDMNRFNVAVKGATGDRVRWLQRRLGIPQSGVFDAGTERALRAFQTSKGITADGVVDPRTFAYLCWSRGTALDERTAPMHAGDSRGRRHHGIVR
jgi:lysozyme